MHTHSCTHTLASWICVCPLSVHVPERTLTPPLSPTRTCTFTKASATTQVGHRQAGRVQAESRQASEPGDRQANTSMYIRTQAGTRRQPCAHACTHAHAQALTNTAQRRRICNQSQPRRRQILTNRTSTKTQKRVGTGTTTADMNAHNRVHTHA
eukprot:2773787-Pleurochrysis_carterae.AAC.4